MQPAAAQSFILDKLTHELSTRLVYHNVNHTEKTIEHCALIAETEGISDHELDLLLTAAAFHDAGFLHKYTGHEEVSCQLAREFLPQFQFSETDIEAICEIIMATKIPQTPLNKLSTILCDADLFYLGTDDYGSTAEKLYTEFYHEGIVNDKMEWQRQQASFLKNHAYFTHTAQKLLSDKKEKNLIVLKSKTESPHTIKHHESTIGDILLIIAGVMITTFD